MVLHMFAVKLCLSQDTLDPVSSKNGLRQDPLGSSFAFHEQASRLEVKILDSMTGFDRNPTCRSCGITFALPSIEGDAPGQSRAPKGPMEVSSMESLYKPQA